MNDRAAGFTLLEVLLAVTLSSGLLYGVLVFHQQTSRLRVEIEEEVETIAAARRVMENITLELQGVLRYGDLRMGVDGFPDRIEFLTTALPSRSAWTAGGEVSTPPAQSGLRLVGYRRGGDGLERTEVRLITALKRRRGLELQVAPLTKRLEFVRFRYHDGRDWKESWNSDRLPRGVEVTLGAEPLPADVEAREYPYRIFRRLIHLPAAGRIGVLAPGSGGGRRSR